MAGASAWAVLPVKAFQDAKSRLQPVLDAQRRAEFARGLMLHVIEVLLASERIDKVVVVSADAEALGLAEAAGAIGLTEAEPGLNRALEQARRYALENGAASLLVMASDLPLLTVEDIDALAVLGQDDIVVIAPDRARHGTNALLLRPPGLIAFSFGKSSFQRHLELGRAAGFEAVEISPDGLTFDVDLPEDWSHLQAAGWSATLSTEPSTRGA